MKKSWLTKRLAAFVLAPSVVLAGFAIALPATFFSVAEKANATDRAATDHTGPIGDKENDPWPQSFPRDNSLTHQSNITKRGRIALVFDFDARYTWETMGGTRIPNPDGSKPGRPNFEQSQHIKKYLRNLRGAPVSVGIYTFDKFSRADNNYPNVALGNTPDLPATSLENKRGFDTVMRKLDSLDATGGTGVRKGGNSGSDDISNQQQGLQKVINDMDKYKYTDVFLFTAGKPNRCGVRDQGCGSEIQWSGLSPDQKQFLQSSGMFDSEGNYQSWVGNQWTFQKDGLIAAALKAHELQKKGATLRIMHMYVHTGVNKDAVSYGGYMLGKKITAETTNGADGKKDSVNLKVNGQPDQSGDNSITNQWITIRHAGIFEDYWKNRKNIWWHPEGQQYPTGRPDGQAILAACNNWHGIGGKYLPEKIGGLVNDIKLGGEDSYNGGHNSMNCNHVRDGKFGKTIVDWLKKVRGVAVVNDQVDQDLRYIKPNAERTIQIVRNDSQTVNYTAGSDGMVDTDTSTGEPVAKVVVPETSGKSKGHKQTATEKLTPFMGTDNRLHTARCVGWSVEDEPKLFYPDNYSLDEWGYAGFRFTGDQQNTYSLIKCAMYSRPLQEVQILKEAQVRNEQIRFVVGGSPVAGTNNFKGGASYEFEWKCTDPKSLEPDKVISSSDGKSEAERRRTINGLNVDSRMDPLGIGIDMQVSGNGTKSMLPVGAKCEVTETIKLPSGISENQSNQLFTSENEVTGRNYKIDTTGLPAGTKPEKIGQEQNGEHQAVKSHTFGSSILYKPNATGDAGVSPISQLVSKTYYESRKAGISLRLKTSNSDRDPAYTQVLANAKGNQQTVPVYYNCRFMPDPTKPPELPETNQGSYPGYVEVGWAQAPVDGSPVKVGYTKNDRGEEVPAWPVGTHCLFSTSAPAKIESKAKPLSLPGFASKDKYASTVCAKDWYVTGKTLTDCGNNYFWVRSDGDQEIELTQDFTRQYGSVEVTKTLSGEAQSQGANTAYAMGLGCSQENIDVPLRKGSNSKFSVKPGSPKIILGVPAGANCALTESYKQPDIPNVTVKVPADEIPINPIKDVNRPQPVSINNELVYKTGSLLIRHRGDYTNPLLPGVADEIKKKPRDISVNCYDINRGVHTYSASIPPTRRDHTFTGIPAGSTCTISADTSSFTVDVTQTTPSATPGKPATVETATHTVLVASSPVTVQITANKETEAEVTSVFSHPVAGEVQLSSVVKEKPVYRELVEKIPDSVMATVTCGGKPYWSGELEFGKNGQGKPVTITSTKIPAKSRCILSAKLFDTWPTELDGSSTLLGDTAVGGTVKNSKQLNFEFIAPEAGKGTSLVLNHSFAMAMAEVELSVPKPKMWTSAKKMDSAGRVVTAGYEVPNSWKDALLAGVGKVPATVTCSLGESVISYPLQLPNNGEAVTQEIPRGWDCSASVDPMTLKLRGTDLRGAAWNKDVSSRDQAKTTIWSAAETDSPKPEITWKSNQSTFKAGLTSNYRVQLASFNVKKKVGGEGVAMISGDHMFTVDYSCTLNGKRITLPQPAAINNLKAAATDSDGKAWNAAEQLEKTLESRLNGANQETRSIQIGRFQQGEWHPIDVLPAGAVCTLEEVSDKAKVKSARLDHYWEIAAGYRSREPESKCEASSAKCRPVSEGEIGKVEVILPVDQDEKHNDYCFEKKKPDVNACNALKNGQIQNPWVPDTLPENFAGTMVPWNNYVFEKTEVELSLKLEGNGAALMQDQTVNNRLYCKPPPLVDENGQLVPSDANAAQVIKVPLNFQVSKDASAASLRQVAKQQIPVNYRCVLAQENFPTGDAKLVTRLSYADTVNNGVNTFGDTSNPQQSNSATAEQLKALFTTQTLSEYEKDTNLAKAENENYIAAFKVPEPLTKQPGKDTAITRFNLTNTLTRPGVNLEVAHVMSAGSNGYYGLGKNLTANGLTGYRVKYVCEDKYLKVKNSEDKEVPFKYEGTANLGVNNSATIFLDQANSAPGGAGGTTAGNFLPASSTCTFQLENPSGSDPLAMYPTIALSTAAKVSGDAMLSGRFETERIKADRDPAALEVKPVTFQKAKIDNPDESMKAKLTFETNYFTEQQTLSLGTFTYGKESLVKKAILENTTFDYKYTCKYPKLPGMSFSADEKQITAKLKQILTFGEEVTEDCPAGTPGASSAGKCTKRVVPAGTSCTVTGTPPTSQVDYLKIVTNEIPNTESLWEVNEHGEKTGKLIFAGKTKTVLDSNPFQVTLDGQNRDKVIAYAVYKNGAELKVRRTDENDQTVKGATFELYTTTDVSTTAGPASVVSGEGRKLVKQNFEAIKDSTGQPTGEYKIVLGPGTYQIGTTSTGKNGAELLWQRFEVHVEVQDTKDGDANAAVFLTADTIHSGLVKVTERKITVNDPTSSASGTSTGGSGTASGTSPGTTGSDPNATGGNTGSTTASGAQDPETKSIWDVDVADIRFGDLPLTGGWLPWLLGAAGTMLAGAVVLMLRNRRRDDPIP